MQPKVWASMERRDVGLRGEVLSLKGASWGQQCELEAEGGQA